MGLRHRGNPRDSGLPGGSGRREECRAVMGQRSGVDGAKGGFRHGEYRGMGSELRRVLRCEDCAYAQRQTERVGGSRGGRAPFFQSPVVGQGGRSRVSI